MERNYGESHIKSEEKSRRRQLPAVFFSQKRKIDKAIVFFAKIMYTVSVLQRQKRKVELMRTKGQNLMALVAALVLIALVCAIALLGVGSMPGIFEEGAINKGLDLVGGSRIVYEADVADDASGLEENMATAQAMMRQRLDNLGYTEGTVTRDGTKRLVVEIPNVSDPEEAVQMLGTTAKLEFVDSDGNIVLTSGDITSAKASYIVTNQAYNTYEYVVTLELSSSAKAKFADATEKAAEKTSSGENWIEIRLDGNEVSKPYVKERLESDSVYISGGGSGFSKEYAEQLAGIIASGQLPFALTEVQLDTVEATLGAKALETSLTAGAIGIVLVMIFMIAVYRLPGIVSSIALVAYTAVFGIILVVFKINLSLPGFAGIILSIGMAVDANVIIFERMKEELRVGKSTLAALKAGFKRAFTAILDSNVTTVIASVVLWYFGSGSVKGFAVTLFIGVLLSMLSAVVVTRFLLSRLVGLNITDVRLYGLGKKEA